MFCASAGSALSHAQAACVVLSLRFRIACRQTVSPIEIVAAGNVMIVTVLPDVPVNELLVESLMTRFGVSQSTMTRS